MPIGEVIDFIDYRGKTPPKTTSGIPLVTAKIVKNNVIQEPTEFIDTKFYDEWMTRGIPNYGNVIFTTEAPLGEVAQIKTTDKLAFAQRIIIMQGKSDIVDDTFLFYALQYETNKKRIEARSSGTTVFGIKSVELKKVLIDMPDLETQHAIADTLSCLDDKIALNNRINKTLEEMAQAIFKSWFVDFEPFGGVMPEDWNYYILNDLCLLISKGITPKYDDKSNQVVINQKCIRNKQLDLSLARTHISNNINEKWLNYGDILINSTGEGTLGRAAQFFYDGDNYTVDSHITIVRPAQKCYIYYLGQWCLLREKEFTEMASGSTGQTDLPRERLKTMDCLLPNIDTLEHFNHIIQPILEKRILIQQESAHLAAIRDALLPKLMSGELLIN